MKNIVDPGSAPALSAGADQEATEMKEPEQAQPAAQAEETTQQEEATAASDAGSKAAELIAKSQQAEKPAEVALKKPAAVPA